MEKVVLSYPKLAAFVGDNGLEKSKAISNLKEIAADYSPTFVQKLGEFLDIPFSKLYDGINLMIPEGMNLMALHEENNLIFVPNHQSHADYMALNYVIHQQFKYKIPIHIAGGINLNIFPIGTIFRKSGCFFIRRSFAHDKNYKYTFEAYLYYLLKEGTPIEFFFEGGRSRTGKLLPPRFGLFTMLLDAHQQLEDDGDAKPLKFIPVSIMHEFVPEEKALIKELEGGRKVKESSTQLLKLFKLLKKELGTIHVRLSDPISSDIEAPDVRKKTQRLAFQCYRSVGKGMPVTPISILSLILLDETSGALTREHIDEKIDGIIDFCERFDVPISKSLRGSNVKKSIDRALELLVQDKKIKVVHKEKLNQTFYTVDGHRRLELLYFKNSILHHFLVPCFISSALMHVVNGEVSDLTGLKKYLKQQRDQLKYEFYLPELRDVISKGLEIISFSVNRKVSTIEETMELSSQEFFSISKTIGNFTRAFSYIYEAYYLAAMAMKHFKDQAVSEDEIVKVARDIHDIELEHGRLISFYESFSIPLIRNAIKFFENSKLVRVDNKKVLLIDVKGMDLMIDKLAKDLTQMLTFNHKANY